MSGKSKWLRNMVALGVLVALIALVLARSMWAPLQQRLMGKRTVSDVLEVFGPEAEARLRPHFEEAGVPFPPAEVSLLGFKAEKRVEVWAGNEGSWRHIVDYPILGASGELGPKLKEGDRQVPEGVYAVEDLNPNSSFHLSMKLDYPNEFDRAQAKKDGRTDLGGDIFIHGRTASIGCLAMGDPAIEELFVLVALVGAHNARVVIAPCDLRREEVPALNGGPSWVGTLYRDVESSLAEYLL